MRGDLEAQAAQERTVIADLRSLASAPIRLPPVDLLTERVLSLRALTESPDVQSARTALRSYFKNGTITMTPEAHGGGMAYVARGDFMPLALLADKAETPSEGAYSDVIRSPFREHSITIPKASDQGSGGIRS